ncbi:hypothetical protein [Govanella unica]|uniref:Motility protein B-like N-terminal domain-containing protein n=1 Tax=Govanella unica TaxID=2975056 RepID=A0A9X3TX48_9PROT|nr:hypothetical protein [Govania unica]MDA5193224.1 hypothetical protein [Govania unica]
MSQSREPDRTPFDALAPHGKGAEESVKLLVPLFLILITFFMVMNAISNQRTGKAGRVVDSVNTAFRGGDKPYMPRIETLDLLAQAERDVHHDLFYEQGKATLQALIDFPGAYAASGGTVMQVELRDSVLFSSGDVTVRPDQTKFMNALADLLKKESSGEERTVEVLFAVPPAAFRADRNVARAAMARAAAMARELEDRGVPGRSITMGLVPDKRQLMWLTFASRKHAEMERDRKGAPEE